MKSNIFSFENVIAPIVLTAIPAIYGVCTLAGADAIEANGDLERARAHRVAASMYFAMSGTSMEFHFHPIEKSYRYIVEAFKQAIYGKPPVVSDTQNSVENVQKKTL